MREPLQALELNESLPARREALTRSSVFASLESLAINVALEFNRTPGVMRWYITRYRKGRPEVSFAVRRSAKPGWCKVWRVK